MQFARTIMGSAMTLALMATAADGQSPVAMKIPAPELRGVDAWINSRPLQLRDLKGKVIAFHFWTFG